LVKEDLFFTPVAYRIVGKFHQAVEIAQLVVAADLENDYQTLV